MSIGWANLTSGLIDSLYTNFDTTFSTAFDQARREAIWPQFCTVIRTNTANHEFNMTQLTGGMHLWKGSRAKERILGYDPYNLEVKKFEYTLEVGLDELKDDKIGDVQRRITQLGVNSAVHLDLLVAGAVNAAISNSATYDVAEDEDYRFGTGFDSKYLFATNHAWTAGTYTSSQDNLMGSATANEGKLSDETYTVANIAKAIQRLSVFKWPNGAIIGSRPTHLVCAADVEMAARRALNSAELYISARGTTDTLYERGNMNYLAGRGIQLIVDPYLYTGYWFLADLSQVMRPFIVLINEDVTFQSNTTGDTAFNEDILQYGTKARYQVGFGPWWTAICGDNT